MEPITKELTKLQTFQRDFSAGSSHLVPDMVLLGFIAEVAESAEAVLALLRVGLGHRAFSNARTAFEAMQQLLLLVTDEDYDLAGAKAWVYFERRGFDIVEKYGSPADLPSAPEEYPEKSGLALALAEITDIWNSYSPGKGEIISRAAQVLAAQPRRPDNWAGVAIAPELQRRLIALGERYGKQLPASNAAQSYSAAYSILTRESHPRTRFQPNQIIGNKNGTVRFRYEAIDPEAAGNVIALTAGAVAQTVLATRIRLLISDA